MNRKNCCSTVAHKFLVLWPQETLYQYCDPTDPSLNNNYSTLYIKKCKKNNFISFCITNRTICKCNESDEQERQRKQVTVQVTTSSFLGCQPLQDLGNTTKKHHRGHYPRLRTAAVAYTCLHAMYCMVII